MFVNVGGGYVEKQMFFFLVSNIKYFISIFDLFTDSPSYIYIYNNMSEDPHNVVYAEI
jgi:hypothetical protein